jgi:prephenate dehydrogenase
MDEVDFRSSRILIAGLGLIGGSMAKALRAAGCCDIEAYDADEMTLEQAKRDGVIRVGHTSLQGGAFGLVLCCLPPCGVAAFYEQVKPYIREGGVFAEMGGLKKGAAERLEALSCPEHELLCLHPMAGSEKKGYAYSDAAMFKGAPLILTPTAKTGSHALAWAVVIKDALGCADMPTLTAARHDEVIADVSHLPHVVALALRASCAGSERFAGGSYKAITRVADVNAALWAGLLTGNAEYLGKSIARFREALDVLQRAIEARDEEALYKLLEQMPGKGEQ